MLEDEQGGAPVIAKSDFAGTMSKADFIRLQPADMPADEVVAKAKAAGLKLSAGHVRATRSLGARKKKTGPKPRTGGGTMTRSEFIRALPMDMPTAEVVAKGKAAGFADMNAGLVNTTRSMFRRKKGKIGAHGGSAGRAKAASAKGKPLTGSAFIRAQPLTMPAGGVVKKASAAGVRVTNQLVHSVRSLMRLNAHAPARASAKGGPAPYKGPIVTMGDFIRAQPLTMPVEEVIAKGKAAGFALALHYVRTTRSNWRKGWTSSVGPKGDNARAGDSGPRGLYKGPIATKTDFVRAQPFDLSAEEVIAKGKAAGFVFHKSFVHQTRSVWRAQKESSVGPSPTGKRPRSAAGAEDAPVEFIRAQNPSMAARDVVAAGARHGIHFSNSLVYKTRGHSHATQTRTAAALRRQARAAARGEIVTIPLKRGRPAHGHDHGSTSDESALRKLAFKVGIPRAREIISALETRMSALLDDD